MKVDYYDVIELELNTLKNEYRTLTLEIPRDESYADQIKRHQLQGKIAGIEYALKAIDNHRATINADLKENN